MAFNKSVLISMLVIGLLATIFTATLMSLASTYNLTVDPAYANTFNEYNETLTIINTHDNISESGNIYQQGFGMNIYTNSIVAAKQMEASGSLFIILIQQVPTILNIPAFVIYSLIAIALTLSTFAFLYVITKGDP
jgi:hypothetical protein